MIPQYIPLTPITEGDAFPGIPAIQIRTGPEGGPYVAPEKDLTLARLIFGPADGKGAAVVLSSAVSGEINITSAANWEITIPRQVIPGLTAGRWNVQLKLTDADGMPETYIETQQLVRPTV